MRRKTAEYVETAKTLFRQVETAEIQKHEASLRRDANIEQALQDNYEAGKLCETLLMWLSILNDII